MAELVGLGRRNRHADDPRKIVPVLDRDPCRARGFVRRAGRTKRHQHASQDGR